MAGFILGSVNLCKYFHKYLKFGKMIYLSSITLQFLNFMHRRVFELLFFCVTVQPKNKIAVYQWSYIL